MVMMHRILRTLVLVTVTVTLPVAAVADGGCADYEDGQRYYQARKFKQAVEALERSVESSPEVSEYHFWLGKAYGRLAEESNFLVATGLAKKTRKQFERALALDRNSVPVLEALRDWHTRAPAFIGGSAEEARKIEHRLEMLDRGSDKAGPDP